MSAASPVDPVVQRLSELRADLMLVGPCKEPRLDTREVTRLPPILLMLPSQRFARALARSRGGELDQMRPPLSESPKPGDADAHRR